MGLVSWEFTPPKTNMEPENGPLEKEKHLETMNFLGSILVLRGVRVPPIQCQEYLPFKYGYCG